MTPGPTFDIEGVNGIDLRIALDRGPGLYRLLGPNGAGKTSTLHAVRAALGDTSATAEPTDGIEKGTVRGPGVTVTIGKTRRSNGVPDVTLADASPVSALIDPQIKDPVPAQRAMMRALLTLVPIDVDANGVLALCGGDRRLLEAVGPGSGDLLGLSSRVRAEAQKLARDAEAERERQHGRLQAAEARLAKIDTGPRPERVMDARDAERLMQAAAGELALKQQSARQRQQLEQQQARARDVVGAEPDVRASRALADIAAHEVHELEALLAATRAKAEAADAEHVRRLEAHKRWQEAQRVLAAPLVGACAEDVAGAERHLARVREDVARHAAVREMIELEAEAGAARTAMLRHDEHAKALRSTSDGVSNVLARILRDAGLPGLTISARGRLAVVGRDGSELDWMTRLSVGQRVRLALELGLRSAAGGGSNVFALDGALWASLDDTNKAEVHAIARELGVYLLTEEPALGELRIEPLHPDQEGQP